MKIINNEVLSEFCNRLIEEMEKVGEDEEIEGGIDTPFWMAVLSQKFSGDISDLTEFIEDLTKWSDYLILIGRNPFGTFTIEIVLWEIFEYDDDYSDQPDYNYEIRLDYDERYNGYCDCAPHDKGYREDKECCGESCDWDAPKFSLHKIMNITSHEFDGYEKDCWNFEDEFYKNRNELSDINASKERELEIEMLTSQLNDIAERIEKIREADSKRVS